MGQRNEDPYGEPLGFPVGRLPEDSAAPTQSPATPQSWSAYPAPEAEGQEDQRPGYWAAQVEAARRGSIAWGFAAFFLGYAGYYVVGMILSGVMSSQVSGFDPARPPDLGPLLLLSFAPNLLLGLVPALFSWRVGHGLRSDFGIVPKRRDVKIGLACGGAALVTSWVLSLIIISLAGPPPRGGLTDLVEGQRGIWLVLFALFAFLGAPFTEELLVRGALWGAFEHYRVPRLAVLVLTALIFAFMHEEAWRMPVLFVGGLAMGIARMITGRVSASMIAHATNNFLPAVAIFFLSG